MVLLSRIYTKGGDKGKSSLGDGSRLPKHHVRFQAIGSVDELNASIGILLLGECPFQDILRQIQNDLFDVGGDLCFPQSAKTENSLEITAPYIERLEKWIDEHNKDLPELRSFILPGGSSLSAHLHVSRTIARRAERDLCALLCEEEINPFTLQYLNRLSDLFFVLSRVANNGGTEDILWVPGKTQAS